MFLVRKKLIVARFKQQLYTLKNLIPDMVIVLSSSGKTTYKKCYKNA